MSANVLGLARAPAIVDSDIAPDGPAQLLQRLKERSVPGLSLWVLCRQVGQDTDAPHPLGLLRARRERPRRNRAAKQRNELAAAAHSITSSARARSVGGTVRPSAFAVLRLSTKSYLIGACTSRAVGLSPLRMRST